jgi:RNA polymerase sigma-70 factor (ECF subfamily)
VTAAGEPSRGLFARALDLPGSPETSAAAPMNEHEFERLYHAHSGPILGYLIAVTGRRDVADDLLQETFCRLLARPRLGSRPSMDATESRRYLFRIATNLLRDRWRSGDDKPYSEPAEPSQSADLDTSLDVQAALQHLKPRERELLWLAYVEGMDHAEIAAATGLARLSVRMLLYRARNKAALLLNPGRTTR